MQPFDLLIVLELIQLPLSLLGLRLLRPCRIGFLLFELIQLLLRLIQLLVAFEIFDLLLLAQLFDLLLLSRLCLFLFDLFELIGGAARNASQKADADRQTEEDTPAG